MNRATIYFRRYGFLMMLIATLPLWSGCGEKENQVFGMGEVEDPPKFPGKIEQYVQDHVSYPSSAKADSVSGMVRVQFVINEYGKPQQVEVKQSLSPACDSVVTQMVHDMPDWEPGTIDDFPVKVLVELPVQFEYDELESGMPGN